MLHDYVIIMKLLNSFGAIGMCSDCWYGQYQEGIHGRGTRGFVIVTLSCDPCPMFDGIDIEFVNGPTWGRLRERELTLWRCFRTLRAWRPEPSETMHACRVFVVHNMHPSLDFNSVVFLDMLEGLGILLKCMHSYIWRNFLWLIHYYATAILPLCPDDTVTVWHIDCMMCWCLLFCWLRPMYSSRHNQGECRST